MLDELEWPHPSQRRQEAQLILFYKIINGLADILIDVYKGTGTKDKLKFRQIGHKLVRQIGQLCIVFACIIFIQHIYVWYSIA